MKHSIFILTLLSCIALLSPKAIASPDPIADTWHAYLQIPTGELTLIFTINEDEAGALSATMESPDQAPGQQIPISDISVDDNTLSITIGIIGAEIEADWNEHDQHWEGTFSQGMQLPITIKRGAPPKKSVIEGLDGTWKTTINRNGVDLRLILKIQTNDRGTIAHVDSPDTMNMNITVSNLTREDDQITYSIAAISGEFIGRLTTPTTIVGTWAVPNQDTLTITYTKTDDEISEPERKRPQVPTKPYGYRVQEITYENPLAPDVALAGTLTLPDGEGPFPAAILISGSGPQDRDETVFGHKPFLVLADHLTKHGIAVLRYDDRGTNQSTGDFSQANSADFATDANAALNYLLTRPEINHDSIGFIGHSEGGLIAPLAITDPKLGAHPEHPIAFMVMLAGPGTSSIQIVQSQNKLLGKSQGASDEDIAKGLVLNKKIIDAAMSAKSTEEASKNIRALFTDEVKESMNLNDANITSILTQFTSPWIRYFLTYDPAEHLPNINIPILALNGQLDLQVPSQENLDGLRAMLADHPDATITELPNLNHMFQTAKTGAMGEYNDIEETFAPSAMNIISEWINERFGANK